VLHSIQQHGTGYDSAMQLLLVLLTRAADQRRHCTSLLKFPDVAATLYHLLRLPKLQLCGTWDMLNMGTLNEHVFCC